MFVLQLDADMSCVAMQSSAGPQECHAFVLWFDTDFSQRFCKEHAVKLSTSPYGPQTHWCQTVLVLRYRPLPKNPTQCNA